MLDWLNGYIYFKPLSHWTVTVLRHLATDIASGSQSSLETVASDSIFPRMCCKVVAKILNMFKNFMRQNFSQNGRNNIAGVSNPSPTPRNLVAILLEHDIFAR